MSTPPPPHATRTVRVALGDGRGYDVVIGSGVLHEVPGRISTLVGESRPWFLICDEGVPASHAAVLTEGAKARRIACHRTSWTPHEENKKLSQAGRFINEMAKQRIERGCPVVALGGGITGDVAGFAAAIYQRGTPWINCPTTLLAMVDASVGGKTGVNHRMDDDSATYKNVIGAFHQPLLVVADVATLTSLSPRVFRAGLAECVKHTLISADWKDPDLLDWTKTNLAAILERDEEILVELISRNIAVKAAVVAADELESGKGTGGGRMALNLGHTFAHAFETIFDLSPDGDPANSPLQHGEAVGLGLIAAARCSEAAGICPPGLADEVSAVIASCGLPTQISGLPDDGVLIPRMLQDKKVRDAKLRLILPTKRGRVSLFEDESLLSAVRVGISAIRAP